MTVRKLEFPAHLATRPLGLQLISRFIAIIASVSLALTATCLLALGRALDSQLDDQVRALASRHWMDPQNGTYVDGLQGTKGAFVIQLAKDGSFNATVMADDGVNAHEIPEETRKLILGSTRDGKIRAINIPKLGSYRVWIDDEPPAGNTPAPDSQLEVLAVGQPVSPVFTYMGIVALTMGALALLAIVAAIYVAHKITRDGLSSLSQLAKTADAISQMNLAKGDIDINVEVTPARGTPSSETVAVAKAFNRMLENVRAALIIRQASEAKVRQFVADASHELRNPLAAIRGYTEIMQLENDTLSPNVAFAVGRIDAESERMQRLVEDLLTLARLDAGPTLKYTDVDLNDLIVRALSDVRASDTDHVWQLDLPVRTVVAPADEQRLHQVLTNLLINGKVHTPAGTMITAKVSSTATDAVVSISNGGPPIPPEKLDVIFERFARVDESRVRNGPGSTGLGLAIVKSVMDAHHGICSVTSDEKLTTFTLTLPLVKPEIDSPSTSD